MIINNLLVSFKKEDGQAIVEYVLIIALILLVLAVAVKAVGIEMMQMYFEQIWDKIKNALS